MTPAFPFRTTTCLTITTVAKGDRKFPIVVEATRAHPLVSFSLDGAGLVYSRWEETKLHFIPLHRIHKVEWDAKKVK